MGCRRCPDGVRPLPARLIQVRTAYVVPYGALKNDTLNDAYTIHQTFIRANDTCFGGWNFIDLWDIAKSGDSLVVNRKKYAPYKGGSTHFFPEALSTWSAPAAPRKTLISSGTGGTRWGLEIELTASVKGIRDSGTNRLPESDGHAGLP